MCWGRGLLGIFSSGSSLSCYLWAVLTGFIYLLTLSHQWHGQPEPFTLQVKLKSLRPSFVILVLEEVNGPASHSICFTSPSARIRGTHVVGPWVGHRACQYLLPARFNFIFIVVGPLFITCNTCVMLLWPIVSWQRDLQTVSFLCGSHLPNVHHRQRINFWQEFKKMHWIYQVIHKNTLSDTFLLFHEHLWLCLNCPIV